MNVTVPLEVELDDLRLHFLIEYRVSLPERAFHDEIAPRAVPMVQDVELSSVTLDGIVANHKGWFSETQLEEASPRDWTVPVELYLRSHPDVKERLCDEAARRAMDEYEAELEAAGERAEELRHLWDATA